MLDINYFAVIVAAVASFVVGGLWYSPMLFGNLWCREAGIDPEKAHPPKVFMISLMFSLIAALFFAMWLGPNPDLLDAVIKAAIVGFAFVGASFGINYQFANRSTLMWAIDSGYHTVQFIVFGVILGLWH